MATNPRQTKVYLVTNGTATSVPGLADVTGELIERDLVAYGNAYVDEQGNRIAPDTVVVSDDQLTKSELALLLGSGYRVNGPPPPDMLTVNEKTWLEELRAVGAQFTEPTTRKELRRLKAAAPSPVDAGRNDRCPCGSGKKYKRCHLGKELPR